MCLSWHKDWSHAMRMRKSVYEICEVDNLLEKEKDLFSFGTMLEKQNLA